MALKLHKDPNSCPGAYSLDCYCKYENPAHDPIEFPHQFVGETYGVCARQARRRGWVLHRDGFATCPKCVAALKLV